MTYHRSFWGRISENYEYSHYVVLRSINKLMSVQVRFCGQTCFGNKNEKSTFNLQSVWISKLNINAYIITILNCSPTWWVYYKQLSMFKKKCIYTITEYQIFTVKILIHTYFKMQIMQKCKTKMISAISYHFQRQPLLTGIYLSLPSFYIYTTWYKIIFKNWNDIMHAVLKTDFFL